MPDTFRVTFTKEVETEGGARQAVMDAWSLLHGEPTRVEVRVWYHDPDGFEHEGDGMPNSHLLSKPIYLKVSGQGMVDRYPRMTPRPYLFGRGDAYTQLQVANTAASLVHLYVAVDCTWNSEDEARKRVIRSAASAAGVDFSFASAVGEWIGVFVDSSHDQTLVGKDGPVHWDVDRWMDWSYDMIEG